VYFFLQSQMFPMESERVLRAVSIINHEQYVPLFASIVVRRGGLFQPAVFRLFPIFRARIIWHHD